MHSKSQTSCFQNILVGYDGSPASERAWEVALTLARNVRSRIEVLAVARPAEPGKAGAPERMIDEAHQHYRAELRKIYNTASQEGIQIKTDVAVGQPAEQLLNRAEQSHSDLIVVGKRGRSPFEKLVLGSISERVLRYAPCPVLLIGAE